ncbi:MAG: hypothetical protein KGH49_01505 [Candidatus Micrarchaeota archaeon]|nr:hypothetical protein [Candidatus Micrarchaeota archaeon]
MNLLTRVVIAAVIVAIVLVGVYFVLQEAHLGQQVTKQQAVALITNYLQNKAQNTVVNVTNVTASVYPGSWHVIASVTFNATSPCPSYAAYSFDYPQYGFVQRVQNNYTSHCVIFGLLQNRSYILAAAPLAIARSYNLSIPSINGFVGRYGYNNVVVHANFYNSIILLSKTYENVWLVNYSAPIANYSVYAAITQSGGNLLTNYTIAR